MRFDQIRATISFNITQNPALAALGTPIIFDPFADPNVTKKTIADHTRTTGVMFEVGFPTLVSAKTELNGTTQGEARVNVYIAEHKTTAHTPSLEALIEAVIVAVTKNLGPQKPIRAGDDHESMDDGAYLLHRITFFAPVLIK